MPRSRGQDLPYVGLDTSATDQAGRKQFLHTGVQSVEHSLSLYREFSRYQTLHLKEWVSWMSDGKRTGLMVALLALELLHDHSPEIIRARAHLRRRLGYEVPHPPGQNRKGRHLYRVK